MAHSQIDFPLKLSGTYYNHSNVVVVWSNFNEWDSFLIVFRLLLDYFCLIDIKLFSNCWFYFVWVLYAQMVSGSTELIFTWLFNLKCLKNFLSTLFFWSWRVLITLRTITIVRKIIWFPKPKSFEYSKTPRPNGIPRTALSSFLPDFSSRNALKISYQPFSSEADGYWSLSEPSQ